jgi:hypothetical protein
VGWYSTGPRLKEADLDIQELMMGYCDNPVLVICEVQVGHPARHPAADAGCLGCVGAA